MRRYLPVGLLLLASVLFGAPAVARLHGQAPVSSNQKAPAFEVASIKQHKSFEPGGGMRFQPGGLFQGTNVYVLALIAAAFGEGRPLLPARIDGAPDWLRFDRFEITAKTNTPIEDVARLYRQLPALVRSLLEDRFRLKTHWETRQLPTYALVIAHKDGSLGRLLRRSNCTPRPETIRTDATLPESAEARPLCNVTFGTGMIQGSGLTILTLAGALSTSLERVVVDGTGLEGTYDVKLQWIPDAVGQPNIDSNIPPLSTALQEQLGLKLESTKGPVDVLVIDHVERPTED